MNLKAVFFDLDGTLLDTAPDFIACVNQVRAAHGMSALPPADIRAEVSNGARALTRLAFHLQQDAPELEYHLKQLLAAYRDVLGRHCALFTGMAETLQWIAQQGLSWGIVTNKPAGFTLPLLERIVLPSQPAIVICPDHVSRTKPDPEPLFLACQQAGCTPAQAIYFGDHARDIEAGRNAAMPTVACAYGYLNHGERAEDWQADYLIHSAAEIPALLTSIK